MQGSKIHNVYVHTNPREDGTFGIKVKQNISFTTIKLDGALTMFIDADKIPAFIKELQDAYDKEFTVVPDEGLTDDTADIPAMDVDVPEETLEDVNQIDME